MYMYICASARAPTQNADSIGGASSASGMAPPSKPGTTHAHKHTTLIVAGVASPRVRLSVAISAQTC